MAKRQPRNRPASDRPAPDDAAMRAKGFAPFMRPEHISNPNEWFLLTGWNVAEPEKKQIKVEIENEKGDTFVLGVREGSPDHRLLFRTFGAETREWRNGGLKVKAVEGSRGDGARFVNIAEADPNPPIWADR